MKDFDTEFEGEVLAECLRNARYLSDATRVLDQRHFSSDAHGWIWRVIKSVWKESTELATPAVFRARAAIDIADTERRGVQLGVVVELFRKRGPAPRASLEELRRFARIAQLQTAIEESVRAQESGDWDEAWKPILTAVRHDVRKVDYQVSRWSEDFDSRQVERKKRKEHPELYRCIPTGYKRLDHAIVGAQEGELCGIMATTNRGKSILAVNIGYNALLRGFGVIHFSTEMGHAKVAQRYDSCATKIEHKKFRRYDFTGDELVSLTKYAEGFRQKYDGRLRIVSTPLRSCDIDLVRGAIDDLRTEMSRIDMIIVDSGDHLQSRGRFEKQYMAEGNNYWDLKDLAEELDLPIWVTLQAKAEFETKTASTRAAAGSYDKSRICDLLLSINEPEKSKAGAKDKGAVVVTAEDTDRKVTAEVKTKSGKRPDLVLYVAKVRDDESKFFIPLEADLKRMRMKEMETSDDGENDNE